jgi:hypothetical protein
MERSATEATVSRPFLARLLNALAAGLGGLVATALFLGVFDGGLPRPARAEAAALAAASGPARPSAPVLCFHGAGGELLDFAPAGQRCP